MITAEKLRTKAENQYRPVLKALVRGEDPFPLPVPYGRLRTTAPIGELREAIAAIRSQSQESLKRGGYTVEWTEVDLRRYGRNQFPGALSFATADDFFGYLDKPAEARQILANARRLTEEFPGTREWAARNLRALEKSAEFWENLVRTVRFFAARPFPGVFARELPVAIPTKFIEENGGVIESLLAVVAPASLRTEGSSVEERLGLKTAASLVEVRLLDRDQMGVLPFSHFTAAVEELASPIFAAFERVVIVENRTTFLTLPPLPRTLALLGQGFALHRFAPLAWLREKRLLYWGDLDVEGFEILAGLRSRFPHVEPVLMDRRVFEQVRTEAVPGSGKKQLAESARPNLTPVEVALVEELAAGNLRIEQEKIPQALVSSVLDGFRPLLR